MVADLVDLTLKYGNNLEQFYHFVIKPSKTGGRVCAIVAGTVLMGLHRICG